MDGRRDERASEWHVRTRLKTMKPRSRWTVPPPPAPSTSTSASWSSTGYVHATRSLSRPSMRAAGLFVAARLATPKGIKNYRPGRGRSYTMQLFSRAAPRRIHGHSVPLASRTGAFDFLSLYLQELVFCSQISQASFTFRVSSYICAFSCFILLFHGRTEWAQNGLLKLSGHIWRTIVGYFTKGLISTRLISCSIIGRK